jgi:hypothetical protein
MRKTIISLVAALASLVPTSLLADGMPTQGGKAAPGTPAASTPANADHVTQADLAANAPDEYTVVKGDTLWGISGRFLKDPWKWPQIWQMNRDEIKNPHWIYPGDVIHLDRSGTYPSLSLGAGGASHGVDAAAAERNVVRLEPKVRVESLTTAVPTIPANVIGPFLTQPLVVEAGALDNAPKIIATEEGRLVVSAGETAYADRIGTDDGVNWQVFRPGEALKDPDTGEVLGYEATYIGDARVRRFGFPTTLQVTKAVQEINRGDRLARARETSFPNFVPHAPDHLITGSIMSVEGGVAEIGQYQVITINRGSRDGMQIGHVLASYHRGATISGNGHDEHADIMPDMSWFGGWFSGMNVEPVHVVPDVPNAQPLDEKKGRAHGGGRLKLPDERNGLIFVFRVFDKMSYAMVMRATSPIYIGDIVRTP